MSNSNKLTQAKTIEHRALEGAGECVRAQCLGVAAGPAGAAVGGPIFSSELYPT